MRQRQQDGNDQQRDEGPAREREERRRNTDQEEEAAGQLVTAVGRIDDKGGADRDQRHHQESQAIGALVDHDRRRHGDVQRVLPDGLQDHEQVRNRRAQSGYGKAGQDPARLRPASDDEADHYKKRNRFEEVGAVQPKRRSVVGRDENRDRAGHDEQNGRQRQRSSPLRELLVPPGLEG